MKISMLIGSMSLGNGYCSAGNIVQKSDLFSVGVTIVYEHS